MIIAIIFLLFTSLFFSGSETGLTAVNRMKLRTRANNGDARAEKILELISKPSVFITTILIGNNIANIIMPSLVTAFAIQNGYDLALTTAIITVAIIIFCEVIPKSMAAAFPEKTAYIVYPAIRFFAIIFKPITILLNKLTGLITRVLYKGQQKTESISKADFRTLIDIADAEGTFEKGEYLQMRGILDFQKLKVKEVMKTPRVEIIAIPIIATYEEVRDIVMNNPFTRYPVYQDDIDKIVGVFHSKYLIHWSTETERPFISFCDMAPLFVYEFQSVEWIFKKMTIERKHMAIMLDEYGGTEGIITHEDIVEEIIGHDIEDEMDLDNDVIVEKLTETEIICDGKITLHRLNYLFDIEIPDDEYVLAAYLLREFSSIPEEGAVLERENLTFKILETDGNSIEKVQIIK